jgi:hypothetical protein
MSKRLRRQSFLRACERITRYYGCPFQEASEEKEEIMTDVEEPMTTIPSPRRIQYTKEVSAIILKSNLNMMNMLSPDQRSERIRLATNVFQAVLHSDQLLRENTGFRDTVYMKIDELIGELDHYVDQHAEKIEPHLIAIQAIVDRMSRTIPEANQLSIDLEDWFDRFQSLKEDQTYLRSLFNELLVLRPRYYESI